MNKDYLLYRGKTISGEIVTGNLTVLNVSYNTIPAGMYISNSEGMPFAYQVMPDSIKRCTGYTDRYSNLLFEDDAVIYTFPIDAKNEGNHKLVIKWHCGMGCWTLYNGHTYKNIADFNKTRLELIKNTKKKFIQLYRGVDISGRTVYGLPTILNHEYNSYLPGVYMSDGESLFTHTIKPETLSECTPYKDINNSIICVDDTIVCNDVKYTVSKKENGLYICENTETGKIMPLEDLINSNKVVLL